MYQLTVLDDLFLYDADYAAFRNETTGSYFIQQFCSVMSQRAHQEHFTDILTQVTDSSCLFLYSFLM